MMKGRILTGMVLMFGFSLLLATGCATQSTIKGGAIVADEITATATVTAVDDAKKTVTLKFSDGAVRTYKLTDAVKNFDQIKVGDLVRASLIESVAIFVANAGAQPGAAEAQTVEVAKKGDKPGVLITDTVQLTAKVMAIDYTTRIVTLKMPDGDVRSFIVDKRVERLNEVKVGDDVVLQVTEALLLAVEKA